MSKRIDSQSLAFIRSRLGDVLDYCAVRARQLDDDALKVADTQSFKKNAFHPEKAIHQGGGSCNHNTPHPTANSFYPKSNKSPRCSERDLNDAGSDLSDEKQMGDISLGEVLEESRRAIMKPSPLYKWLKKRI